MNSAIKALSKSPEFHVEVSLALAFSQSYVLDLSCPSHQPPRNEYPDHDHWVFSGSYTKKKTTKTILFIVSKSKVQNNWFLAWLQWELKNSEKIAFGILRVFPIRSNAGQPLCQRRALTFTLLRSAVRKLTNKFTKQIHHLKLNVSKVSVFMVMIERFSSSSISKKIETSQSLP